MAFNRRRDETERNTYTDDVHSGSLGISQNDELILLRRFQQSPGKTSSNLASSDESKLAPAIDQALREQI